MTQDNANLETMDTSSLLDGFASDKAKAPRAPASSASASGASGGKKGKADRDVIADAGLAHGEQGEEDASGDATAVNPTPYTLNPKP